MRLFDVLARCKTLKLLDLTGNNFGLESLHALGKLVSKSKKLKFLILARQKKGKKESKTEAVKGEADTAAVKDQHVTESNGKLLGVGVASHVEEC